MICGLWSLAVEVWLVDVVPCWLVDECVLALPFAGMKPGVNECALLLPPVFAEVDDLAFAWPPVLFGACVLGFGAGFGGFGFANPSPQARPKAAAAAQTDSKVRVYIDTSSRKIRTGTGLQGIQTYAKNQTCRSYNRYILLRLNWPLDQCRCSQSSM
jgi:hypothetical protein